MPRDVDDQDLLAAYVDGVAELAPDERRAIEAALADSPDARADEAEVRGLIDQLRALPPEGEEPDWAAMERSIRAAVGDRVPRPWWRRWQWIAPASTLLTGLAVLMLVLWRQPVAPLGEPAPVRHAVSAPAPHDDVVALWLDGAEVDVDPDVAPEMLDVAMGDDGDGDEIGLLPTDDLGWVDQLDGDALSRAERWLDGARRPSPEIHRGSNGKNG